MLIYISWSYGSVSLLQQFQIKLPQKSVRMSLESWSDLNILSVQNIRKSWNALPITTQSQIYIFLLIQLSYIFIIAFYKVYNFNDILLSCWCLLLALSRSLFYIITRHTDHIFPLLLKQSSLMMSNSGVKYRVTLLAWQDYLHEFGKQNLSPCFAFQVWEHLVENRKVSVNGLYIHRDIRPIPTCKQATLCAQILACNF